MKAMSLVVFTCAALVMLGGPATGAGPDGVKIQARVEFSSMDEWRDFVSRPDLDIMKSKPGVGVTIVTDPAQLDELVSLGYRVTVEIEDMEEHYASRLRGPNFGDFHTYSETEEFLDSLHATYPDITTAKFSIGTSHLGNNLWAIKISDNPTVDEAEPEVLFDGVHHAREPITVEAQMHFMEWLTQGYGVDPEATFLVDNREIWFVPIMNVDGYLYNETTYPGGGGMWRKNRRDNAGSCEGVDNNRNYPMQWGGAGSSSDPCDETYKGPTAGSEPENQAYMNFVAGRDFVTNITFHSVAALVLLPWSYTNAHTPDDATFRTMGNKMAQYNGYTVGQPGEVLYNCSGTTTDWNYDQHDVFSLCIEVGGSDFWPQESEIPGLRAENLWPQIYVTRTAGSYLALLSNALTGGNGNGKPDPGETLDLTVTVENQSVLSAATNVSVTLLTDDPYVQLVDAFSTLGSIAASGSSSNAPDPFTFTLDPLTPNGHGLVLTVRIDADGFSMEEEISWLVGTPVTLFSDNMEGGTTNWVENNGLWGLTTALYHSATHSYTDSPSGSYGDLVNTWIQLANPLDLSNAASADLSFWHRYNTEEDYDFCYVEASTDGGVSWGQVGPKYDGDNGTWQQVTLPLAEFCGTANFKLRFRLVSDTYVTDDGWYVDDVVISGPPTGNARPTAPTLDSPANGSTVGTSSPTLTVVNATDADPEDVLTYGFIVYGDELCTTVAASVGGVAEGSGTTGWTVSTALAEGTYWWRAYADDGTERGPLMTTASFTVEASGVDDGTVASLALHPATPNPFSAETRIGFELPARADVSFAIYSVDGRLVRTLVAGAAGPGPVTVTWDGLDEGGDRVASGLYFARLAANGEERRAKVVVLK